MQQNIHVTLPVQFIAVPYFPGYFWHLDEKILYTMKVTGVLRPLKKSKFRMHNGRLVPHDGYRLSRAGRPIYIYMDYLKRLVPVKSVVPIQLEMKL